MLAVTPPLSPLQHKLPIEIIQHIFSLLPPSEALKQLVLCKRIRWCLQDQHFAKLNLLTHFPPSVCLNNPSLLSILRTLWFLLPSSSYQSMIAKTYLLISLGSDQPTKLDWSFQCLYGRIPASISLFSGISSLSLSENNLHGAVPIQLLSLAPSLVSLDLSYNRLTSGWESITQLIHLTNLNMSGNLLEGLLPSELGNLSALEHLLLAEIGLTGTLPREIGKLENLKTLDLKKNRISGSVPVEWSGMRQLRYLYLQSNLLELCPFDAVAEGCKYLRVLDVSDNQLTGHVPWTALLHSGSIWSLSLARNQLELGELSAESILRKPSSCLNWLDISGNSFTLSKQDRTQFEKELEKFIC